MILNEPFKSEIHKGNYLEMKNKFLARRFKASCRSRAGESLPMGGTRVVPQSHGEPISAGWDQALPGARGCQIRAGFGPKELMGTVVRGLGMAAIGSSL